MPRKSQRPVPPPDSWAAVLKAWRKFNGLTQSQAAKSLKVALRTYQQWEGQDYQPSVLTPDMMRGILLNALKD
jgi:DNA-binding XRE family transcriptional regulator